MFLISKHFFGNGGFSRKGFYFYARLMMQDNFDVRQDIFEVGPRTIV